MSYALGVDVGTSYTAAAICRLDGQQPSTDVVPLSNRMPAVSSVIFLGPDGSFVVGEAAERRSVTDPDRVVREFKRRIGDDTPLFVGGRPYAAHDLAAMMVRWVVDRVIEREGGAPDRIAITHPAGWGPFKKDLLRAALGAQGLHDLTFLAEPEAAAVSYATQERVEAGTTIAVYDLGGGTFDAAVVRKADAHKTGTGSFTLMGSADGIEQLGGADFDEAVFNHVRAGLGDQLNALDIDDPSVLSGLTRLRRECTEAKEALSSDTEVSVAVLLPGVNAQVRLVRSEFEEMIRPALEDTIDSLSRAIGSAGLTSADLGAVLLVGGSSRVPLVSQLVSARLGCPVVVDADPKTTIALGAALSMAPMAAMAPQPESATPTPTPTIVAPAPRPADPEPDLVNSSRHLSDQEPDRPIIPIRHEPAGHWKPADEHEPPRRRLLAGVMSGVIAVALIFGAVVGLAGETTENALPVDTPGTAPAIAEPSDPAKISAAGGALQARGRDDDSDEASPTSQQPGAPTTSRPAPAATPGGRGTSPAPAPTTTTPPPPPATTTTTTTTDEPPPPPPPTTTTDDPPPPPPPTTTTDDPPPPPPPTTTTDDPPPPPQSEEPPVEEPPPTV